MTGERISEFDLMRGIALFGIFLMNVVAMAYPVEAYLNPFAFDSSNWFLTIEERSVLDWRMDDTVFSILYVFVHQKMFSLFAMLFGVSATMMLDNVHGQRLRYYFVRNLILFFFGCLHLMFLFYGDILWVYSLCAMFLWMFVGFSARTILISSSILYAFNLWLMFDFQTSIDQFSPEQLIALQSVWMPEAQWNNDTVLFIQSSENVLSLSMGICISCFADDSSVVAEYFGIFTIVGILQVFSLMLLGMGLYKLGFLSNVIDNGSVRAPRYSQKVYRFIAYIGVFVGVALSGWDLTMNYSHQWAAEFAIVKGAILSYIAAPIMMIAYVSLLVLWSQNHFCFRLKGIIQSVGRMALSNYILQSVIGVGVFTGLGFGYFGEFNRMQLLLLAVIVCIGIAVFSTFWMKNFYYGPLEWLWRSVSKFQKIKFRKANLTE